MTRDGSSVKQSLHPCRILGLSGVPQAGDTLVVAPDQNTAKEIADQRGRIRRFEEAAQSINSVNLNDVVRPDTGRQGERATPHPESGRTRLP